MPIKHVVRLSDADRDRLDRITRVGSAHARTIAHARALLLTDASDDGPAWTDEKAADALGTSPYTIARTRKRFVTEGLDEAVRTRKKGGSGRLPKIDGTAEAHLVAMACSQPPEGRARWTVRLLAERYVTLGLEQGWLDGPVSRETVRQTLKKTGSALTASSSG